MRTGIGSVIIEEDDVRYMLLIYTDHTSLEEPPEGMNAHIKAYYDLDLQLRDAGALIEGLPLHPTSTATTVQVRGGETLTTDGPFAETKEQLGGFYLVEAPDLDAAIGWATRIPGAALGSIEVRPVMELPATFEEYQRSS